MTQACSQGNFHKEVSSVCVVLSLFVSCPLCRSLLGDSVTLQGNLDPCALFSEKVNSYIYNLEWLALREK